MLLLSRKVLIYALFSVACRAVVSGFSVLSAEDTWNAANGVPTTVGSDASGDDSAMLIPSVFHRSHKYSVSSMQNLPAHSYNAEARLLRNLNSCARLNPNFKTWFYEDADVDQTMTTRVIPALHAFHPEVAADLTRAWQRLSDDPVLSQIMVLKMDVFRLAVVWLYGGWWLDADALCIDNLTTTLQAPEMVAEFEAARNRWTNNEPSEACVASDTASDATESDDARVTSANSVTGEEALGCVFAWEGEVPRAANAHQESTSSPLNWAFGCVPRHPMPLLALRQSIGKVRSLIRLFRIDFFAGSIP